VLEGGKIASGKGVNIPSLSADFPSLTEMDMQHLDFALKNDFDVIALSFVRKAFDLQHVRELVKLRGGNQLIAAKIEKREAIVNLDDIIASSDCIMVARGDLGVEVGIERIPGLQRDMIHKCNERGIPVITATQMMLSMVDSSTPTRAEVSDLANAIRDGTDAVMLSEETAVGKYPVQAVEMAEKIASITEESLPYSEILSSRRSTVQNITDDAISYAACEVAVRLNAAAIVTPTRSGSTARRVSRFRPPLPIVALTFRENVDRQLALSWGIQPHLIEKANAHDELFAEAERVVVSDGLAREGDRIVIVAGDPASPSGTTDLLKVQTLSRQST
jgi:pyruvate kinase